MSISISHGTLTQVQSTLSPDSEYNLPTTVTVSGATSSYNSTSGQLTLTSPTSSMSVTAVGVAPQPSTTNNIFFGTSAINKVYFGTSEVSKIYYGNTLIYEAGEDIPDNAILDRNGNVIKASDGYLITTELSLYPVKGDIINIGSNTDDFRVMDIQGSTALLLNHTTQLSSVYNETSTTTTFDNGLIGQQYSGSTVDLAMSDYYDNLDSDIKNAIVPTSIKQYIVSLTTSSSNNSNEWEYSSKKYIVYDDEITVGTRNCFLLGTKDLEKYFNGFASVGDFCSVYCENTFLREANKLNNNHALCAYYVVDNIAIGLAGVSDGLSSNNFTIKSNPAFYIDLSNITYNYSYKTLTLKLANCSATQNSIIVKTATINSCVIIPNQNYSSFPCTTDGSNINVVLQTGTLTDFSYSYLYDSQNQNFELSYSLYSDKTIYVPMFEYYKIKFNNNNTYLEKDITNTSNDVSVTFNNVGLPNTTPVTIDGINFTPSFSSTFIVTTWLYVISVKTTNYFWSKDDLVMSGFTGDITLTDNKTISINITNRTSSTPSITVNSHATQYNFKNKTIVLPISSAEAPKAWIGRYNGRGFNFDKYTPSGLGFTSNGTHFIGFYADDDNSGGGSSKSPNSYWYYVNDNNEKVKICTATNGGTATWVSDAYKTLKFDNVNYYDSDLWKMLFIGNGATEQ